MINIIKASLRKILPQCVLFKKKLSMKIYYFTLPLTSDRIGAKTFAKKYFPGSLGIEEIGCQSFDFSCTHPKLQTFLASIRLSSRVRHLNISQIEPFFISSQKGKNDQIFRQIQIYMQLTTYPTKNVMANIQRKKTPMAANKQNSLIIGIL